MKIITNLKTKKTKYKTNIAEKELLCNASSKSKGMIIDFLIQQTTLYGTDLLTKKEHIKEYNYR